MPKPSIPAAATDKPRGYSKQNWNASHYTQVKVSIKPDIADAFKAACAARGVSMAGVLSEFMNTYSSRTTTDAPPVRKAPESKDRLKTRKARRSAVKTIAAQLCDLLAAEEDYYDNVPENLHGSKWHEASEASIAALQEIIVLMDEIYC